MAKRKLLFLTTGGTIASVKTENGLVPLLSSQELLAHLPELGELCQPETLSLCSVDSTDITPDYWLLIANAIRENWSRYDGFIVCHGTDTMGYTAAALSYLIQGAPSYLPAPSSPSRTRSPTRKRTCGTALSPLSIRPAGA